MWQLKTTLSANGGISLNPITDNISEIDAASISESFSGRHNHRDPDNRHGKFSNTSSSRHKSNRGYKHVDTSDDELYEIMTPKRPSQQRSRGSHGDKSYFARSTSPDSDSCSSDNNSSQGGNNRFRRSILGRRSLPSDHSSSSSSLPPTRRGRGHHRDTYQYRSKSEEPGYVDLN